MFQFVGELHLCLPDPINQNVIISANYGIYDYVRWLQKAAAS